MSVVTTKSGPITNRDATPVVLNNAAVEAGIVREAVGTVELATGDTSTSKYIFCQVPSNARISSVDLFSDDCGSLTTMHLGIQKTTADGSGSVSNQLFAASIDIHSGAIAGTNEVFQNGDIANIEKRLWELAGLSSDPCILYDIIGTLGVTADVGGTVSLRVRYVL